MRGSLKKLGENFSLKRSLSRSLACLVTRNFIPLVYQYYEFGGCGGNRTHNLLIKSQLLYLLSYTPV